MDFEASRILTALARVSPSLAAALELDGSSAPHGEVRPLNLARLRAGISPQHRAPLAPTWPGVPRDESAPAA